MRDGIFVPVIVLSSIVNSVWKRYFSGDAILIHVTKVFIFKTVLFPAANVRE